MQGSCRPSPPLAHSPSCLLVDHSPCSLFFPTQEWGAELVREADVELERLIAKNSGWATVVEKLLQHGVDGVSMKEAERILRAASGGTANLRDVKNAHALHYNHARKMWEFHSPAHRVAAEQWLKEQANKE